MMRKKEFDMERLQKAQNSIMRVHLLLEELCESAENQDAELEFKTYDELIKVIKVASGD